MHNECRECNYVGREDRLQENGKPVPATLALPVSLLFGY